MPEDTNPSLPKNILEEMKTEREALIKASNDARMEREALEKVKAMDLAAGTTYSGQSLPEKSEQEKLKEGAVDFWKGSGIDNAIKKYG